MNQGYLDISSLRELRMNRVPRALCIDETTTFTWENVIHMPSKSYHIQSKITINVIVCKNTFIKHGIKHIINF